MGIPGGQPTALHPVIRKKEPLAKLRQQGHLEVGIANFRIGLPQPIPKWKASPSYADYRFRPPESIPAAHARRFVPCSPGAVGPVVGQASSARSCSEHD